MKGIKTMKENKNMNNVAANNNFNNNEGGMKKNRKMDAS